MYRRTALLVAAALFVTPLSPSAAQAWHSRPPGYGYEHHSPYYGDDFFDDDDDFYGHRYYRNDHDDEALLWSLGGVLIGSIFLAALLQQPQNDPGPVYSAPAQTYSSPPQTYSYPPSVPPGMCRWERYIVDPNGRMVVDQYGQPVKEYTLGSCQYPPN